MFHIISGKRYKQLQKYESYNDINAADDVNNKICDMCFTGMTNGITSPDEIQTAYCCIRLYGKETNLCQDHVIMMSDTLNSIIRKMVTEVE